MRWACLFLVACGSSSSNDAGIDATAMDGPPAEASSDDSGTDTGVLEDSGGPITCTIPKGGATCNGLTWQCDQADDCSPGQACCLKLDMKNVLGSTCMAFCNDPKLQLCSASTECSGGAICTPATCSGYVVKTCGGVPATSCK